MISVCRPQSLWNRLPSQAIKGLRPFMWEGELFGMNTFVVDYSFSIISSVLGILKENVECPSLFEKAKSPCVIISMPITIS